MRIVQETNTYLNLRDKYGKIKNQQILIVGKAGTGKTIFSEGIAEKLYKAGYLVIVIGDSKRESEWGFQIFKPKENYHLENLRKIGKEPEGRKVILHHPYTSNIPDTLIPEMNFFTFNLKKLFESDSDTESIKLLLRELKTLKDNEGIYSLLHKIQNAVKGKKEKSIRKADPKNFFLEATSGTLKSVTEISSYLHPFIEDFFLTPSNCPININWKHILQDQENYQVFLNCYIDDSKMRDFLVLNLLEGILQNRRFLKTPVVVVIPEIRNLCNVKPEGAKKYLSASIRDALSLMRSSGLGMSSILDSQNYMEISEEIRDNATATFLGELGGGSDQEKTSKAFNYRRDIRDQLRKSLYPHSFLLVGDENSEAWSPLFPSAMHCEEHYRFEEIFKKELPNNMKKYSDLKKQMREILNAEENKFREIIHHKEKKEAEKLEKEKMEKELSKTEREELKKDKEKAKTEADQKRQQVKEIVWKFRDDGLSLRHIKDKLKELGVADLSTTTIKVYVDERK